MSSKWHKGTGGPAGDEHYNLVTQADIAGPLDAHYGKGPGSRQGGEREYVGVVTATGPVTHALTRSQKGATEDGTGRGTPIVPTIAFHPTQDPISSVEVTHAIGMDSRQGCATAAMATVTGTLSSRTTAAGGLGTDFEVAGGLQPILAPTLTAANDPSRSPQSSEVTQQVAAVLAASPTMAVRRLLPVETERLQGFPDGWTDIPWRGKPAPDGPRYKAMGNSFAVPVVRWIGERLDAVAKGKA